MSSKKKKKKKDSAAVTRQSLLSRGLILIILVCISTSIAPDIISGPGPRRNPAIFSYRPDMAAGYEAGFDHILIHLIHCLISVKNLYF